MFNYTVNYESLFQKVTLANELKTSVAFSTNCSPASVYKLPILSDFYYSPPPDLSSIFYSLHFPNSKLEEKKPNPFVFKKSAVKKMFFRQPVGL